MGRAPFYLWTTPCIVGWPFIPHLGFRPLESLWVGINLTRTLTPPPLTTTTITGEVGFSRTQPGRDPSPPGPPGRIRGPSVRGARLAAGSFRFQGLGIGEIPITPCFPPNLLPIIILGPWCTGRPFDRGKSTRQLNAVDRHTSNCTTVVFLYESEVNKGTAVGCFFLQIRRKKTFGSSPSM